MPSHYTDSTAENPDVAVVGAGAAGLAAAAYLARAHFKVTVLERSSRIGGRAISDTRNGFTFNRGIHALYRGGAATEVLDDLGVSYNGGSPDAAFALSGGRVYPVPTRLSLLLRTGLLAPLEKLEIARFFRSLPRINPAEFAGVSVEEWVGRRLHGARVRRLVSAFARTFLYSDALDVASAEVFLGRLQLALKRPVCYIDGGWQTLVDGLAAAATSAGAFMRPRAGVESIETSGAAGTTLHLTGGETLHARVVILAVGPHDVARLLGDQLPADYRSSIESIIPAEVACLDVALSSAPSSRYPAIQDIDNPRFLATQSRYAQIAPNGGTALQMVKQLRSSVPTDAARDQSDLEELLDLAQPGWRALVVDRIFLPRMEASSMLPTAAGGGLAGRPDHAVWGISGCYLAGDWVGPEGYLLDASLASARRVAELVRTRVAPAAVATAGRPSAPDRVPEESLAR